MLASLLFALVLAGCQLPTPKKADTAVVLPPAEVKTKMEKFVNENLTQGQGTVIIKEVKEEGGLYKLTIDNGQGQTFDSYASLDGTMLFPQGFNLAEAEKQMAEAKAKEAAAKEQALKEMVKNDKPVVEAFVMSHCPYGTQIEKGLIPVVEALGDKIDFQIKFVDYAMHGDKEISEELNQYCINKNTPEKYLSYLKCFLEAGDGEKCLADNEIDTKALSACVKETDGTYKITANAKDQSTFKGSYPTFNIFKEDNEKYGVGGSPTLVVNGKTVETARDSASLLKTICNGFTAAPEECNAELSATSPSAGFGYGEAAGGTDATCN